MIGARRLTGALVLGLLLAPTAWAEEGLGYQRTRVPGTDQCLFWATRTLRYTADAAGSEQTPGDSEFAAIDAAFESWRALSRQCSDLDLIRGPPEPAPRFGYDREDPSTNRNIVTFRERSCAQVVPPEDPCLATRTCVDVYRCWNYGDYTIALTTTTYSLRTGAILDADIELNAAPHAFDGQRFLFTAVSSPPCTSETESTECVATDIQNTLTHEIGHALGLDHVDAPGSTMEPTAPLGETSKRTLDSGTAQGFCDLYPRGLPALTCEQSGNQRLQVTANSRGTPGPFGCAASGSGVAALVLAGVRAFRRRRRQ